MLSKHSHPFHVPVLPLHILCMRVIPSVVVRFKYDQPASRFRWSLIAPNPIAAAASRVSCHGHVPHAHLIPSPAFSASPYLRCKSFLLLSV
jgi:hypothetical protein